MLWTVYGEPGLSFQVDKHGLSISGKGRQTCQQIAGIFVKALPAQWTIFTGAGTTRTSLAWGWIERLELAPTTNIAVAQTTNITFAIAPITKA
jgi:hypothetical protein